MNALALPMIGMSMIAIMVIVTIVTRRADAAEVRKDRSKSNERIDGR